MPAARPTRWGSYLLGLLALSAGSLWALLGLTAVSKWPTQNTTAVLWDSLGGIGAELAPWWVLIGLGLLALLWRRAAAGRIGRVGRGLLVIGVVLQTGAWGLAGYDVVRVQRTLDQHFGPQPGPASAALAQAMLHPLSLDYTGIDTLHAIAYGPAGTGQTLDILRPAGAGAGRRPMLLHVHGGGLISGAKSIESMPLLLQMARAGWLVVTINYRLAPAHRWPAQIEDVVRATAWLQQHGAEYGGDPQFIAGVGGSAGGYLLSLAALAPAKFGGQTPSPLRAVVSLYAVYDLLLPGMVQGIWQKSVLAPADRANPAVRRRASPQSYVQAPAPAFYLIQGQVDGLATLNHAREFVRALAPHTRRPLLYTELAGGHHGFDHQNSLRVAGMNHGIAQFLQHEYNAYVQAR